jgi:hypothetical protein
MMNHYDWLEENLPVFFEKVGLEKYSEFIPGILTADGDKCYGYKTAWEKNGIHFYHGVAIYLISKFAPFNSEVRQTENGWVDPCSWVIENKERFLPLLPAIS